MAEHALETLDTEVDKGWWDSHTTRTETGVWNVEPTTFCIRHRSSVRWLS